MSREPRSANERDDKVTLMRASTPRPTRECDRAEPRAQDLPAENLYLIGRPRLKDCLQFVRRHSVNPPSDGVIVEEWQAANECVRMLEREEAGIADGPPIRKMGSEHEPLLIECLKDPLVRHGFNTVPTEIAIAELDRLVVYQKRIDLTYAAWLEGTLGSAPSEERIFRTCLPYDHPQPPVKWSRADERQFVFMSPSNDLRFLGTMELHAGRIKDYPPPGDVVGVVGIAVGFGSNFMNAVYAENRLILNNGSHRAYALRKLGITHVPCIIQHVSSRDELDAVASSQVRSDPDLYLKNARPMMLKDYFDPRLHKVMPVHRRLRQVSVRFEVDEHYVPVL